MKRTQLKRKPKAPMSARERAQAHWWHGVTVAGGCVMCAEFPTEVPVSRRPDLQHVVAHHVLPKQALKQEHHHAHLWDKRNGFGICDYHHERHHNYIQRIPRAILRDDTHDFAAELNLGWLLDMEYPS